MSSLLSLPRELRDSIIALTISHYADTPSSSEQAGKRIELNDIEYFIDLSHSRPVKYAADIPHTSPFGLLRTCHQLRNETLETMKRLPLTTECDVLIVNEEDIYVTWTHVPPLLAPHPILPHTMQSNSSITSSSFQTTFNIRAHNSFTPTKQNPLSGYEDIVEGHENTIIGPGTIITSFCAIFERFLRLGPSLLPLTADPKTYARPTIVPSVFLNIITPPGTLLPSIAPHYAREYRLQTGEPDAMIHPKALLEMLTNWFSVIDFLEERSGGPPHLGKLLERVGKLKYGLDGVVKSCKKRGINGIWDSDSEDEESLNDRR